MNPIQIDGTVWHLSGGRVIDPVAGIDTQADVLIVDKRVAAIGSAQRIMQQREVLEEMHGHASVVRLEPRYVVAPGFVDLHVSITAKATGPVETLLSLTRAAARGGFATICATLYTQPIWDSWTTIAHLRTLSNALDAHLLPIAALTKGQEGAHLSEMAEFASAGAVAFSDDGHPVSSSRLMRLALEYAVPLGVPVVEHCQDEDLVGGGVMHEGQISTLLGLKGWPAAGEDVMLARDLALVRLTGAKYHAAHLSTAGSVALIRQAKADGLPVTAEVTPHHLLLTDAWVAGEREGPLADALREMGLPVPPSARYDTNTKVNPPLRTAGDCAALLEGLLDGTIDAIATDHAPHTWVDKACEYGEAAFGISGLETAFASLLALTHTGKLPLAALIAALTVRPARAWGLRAGTLLPGSPADIAIFDPDEAWTVNPERFASLGRNTPLAGLTLRGRVRQTWLDGKLVFDAASEE